MSGCRLRLLRAFGVAMLVISSGVGRAQNSQFTDSLQLIPNSIFLFEAPLADGAVALPAAVIVLSPAGVSFGSQVVNTTSSTRAITVRNTGTMTLTVNGMTLTGTDTTQFSYTSSCAKVPAGGSCAINATFKPASVGTKSASIAITHSASGSPSIVALEGSGVAAAAMASLSSAAMGFGSQEVGTVSASRSVTLRNTGTGPLTVSSVVLAGTDAGQFAQTNNCTSVAVGGSCAISAAFKPTSTGTKSASIAISHNAPGAPSNISLSGTATASAPQITLSPTALSFGSQAVDTTSATKAVTVRNSGAGTLTVSAVTLNGSHAAQFVQNSSCASVGAGSSCAINVTFKPTGTGARNATLSISHNAGGSPALVTLDGTGTAASAVISLSPAGLSFGSQSVNTTSISRSITLRNIGSANLTVSAVTLSGADEGQFAQTNNCTSVAVGASCLINATFRPTSTGAKSASLAISHNAGASPSVVSLYGSGTTSAGVISLSSTALSFGNQTVNTSSTSRSVTISNTGTAALTIGNVTLTGSDAGHFAQTSNCTSVAVGAGCTVSVTFKPTVVGAKSASIAIAHNASSAPSTVSLGGSGTAPIPEITLSPTGLSFGSQLVSTTSASRSITVSNTGSAPLSISGMTLTGADANQFAQTNTCTTVAAGGSCTISVIFKPTSAGAKSASLSISNSASASAVSVNLLGTGETTVMSAALVPDCVGANCSAVNGSTYAGSGVGVWRYTNTSTTLAASINISISGVSAGKNVLLLFSNGTKSAAPTVPGAGVLADVGSAPQSSVPGGTGGTSSDDVIDERELVHSKILEENRSLVATLRAMERAQASPAVDSAFSNPPDISPAPAIGTKRVWTDAALGSTVNHATSVQATCSTSGGRGVVFWVEDRVWAARSVTTGVIDRFKAAYCGANGGYERLVKLQGEPWGAHGFNGVISDSPTLQDVNVVMVSSAKGFGGYFWGVNSLLSDPRSNKALVFFVNVAGFSGDSTSSSTLNYYISTLVHEMMHMVNFYQRMLRRDVTHDTWLEETSAMMSEDIVVPTLINTNKIETVRVPGYLQTGGNVSYINWPMLSSNNYAVGGTFGAFVNRRFGLGVFQGLQTCSSDSYGCVDSLINLNGGAGFGIEFARMGASLFGLLSATGLPAQYGFPAKADGGYALGQIDVSVLSSLRPASGAAMSSSYPATSQTFIADTVASGRTTYIRNNVMVPAGTSLVVIIR